ncbi:MAG: hypothetical protein ACRCZE_04245 [Candidatus Altimarinota bacterium]
MAENFNKLGKYKNFVFESYNFDRASGKLSLNYSLDEEVFFEEIVLFNLAEVEWDNVDEASLEKALQAFHLMAGISYYKAYCPEKMMIKTGDLSQKQAEFWNNLYTKGLGEFFYQNQIKFDGLVNFPSSVGAVGAARELLFSDKALLPIGGGKDSLVSAEILLGGGIDFDLFSLRDSDPIRETAEILGKKRLIVGRQISPKLLELNAEGALNGHVPITAYISFLLVICAIIYDYKNIVLSLEKSANFGQIYYGGIDINHQYSKSEQFEEDFNEYVRENIVIGLNYFSLLRGMYEIKIAEIFAKSANVEKYLPHFASCNKNFKLDGSKPKTRWCGECPKCVFVWTILSPFLEKSVLVKVFGKDLYADENLLELFEELLGIRNIKPFECVGTPEEMELAMWRVCEKSEYNGEVILEMFEEKVIKQMKLDEAELTKQTMQIGKNKFIPENLEKLLEKYR